MAFTKAYTNKETIKEIALLKVWNEMKYEVEEILDSCIKNRRLKYLIHWQEYSIDEHTWEPSFNVTYAFEKVKEFHQ